MRSPFRKTFCVALVLLLCFSCYPLIVQIIDTFKPRAILNSVKVEGLQRTASGYMCEIGSTLKVEVESELGSSYDLQVYQNSSVFHSAGAINQSSFSVDVPVDASAFNTQKQYNLVLSIQVCNQPVPGAYFTDSVSQAFDTYDPQPTNMVLTGSYDNVLQSLSATANLTDSDGNPVAGESVGFFLQFMTGNSLTDGWLPLNSAFSESNGCASINVALSDPFDAQFMVKASFEGDDNYGASSSTANVQVVSSTGILPSYQQNLGNVVLQVSNSTPYAGMPMNATATYASDTPLDTGLYNFTFYCDSMDDSGFLGSADLVLVSSSPSYVYEADMVSVLNVTGSHDLFAAVNEAGSIVAFANTTLAVQPCPANIILQFTLPSYGSILVSSVSFAMPRLYEETDSSGMFVTTTSAPQMEYDNETYAIDLPVENITVNLFVNGSLVQNASTSADGVASFPIQLNSSTSSFGVDVNASIDDPTSIYQGGNVEQTLGLVNVTICDPPIGRGNSEFWLNCQLNGENITNGAAYVGENNTLDVTSGLSHATGIYFGNYSVNIGEPVSGCTNNPSRLNTTGTGPGTGGNITSGTQYIHVSSLYDPNPSKTTNNIPASDIDQNGIVGLTDLIWLALGYGSGNPHYGLTWTRGHGYDSTTDMTFDEKIDLSDLVRLALNYGTKVAYVNVCDLTTVNVTFYNSSQNDIETVPLDWSGCISVPPGATKMWFSLRNGTYVGAVYECLKNVSTQYCCDTTTGGALGNWVPDEAVPQFAIVSMPMSDCMLGNNSEFYVPGDIINATSWTGLIWNVKNPSVNFTLQCSASYPVTSTTISVTAIDSFTQAPIPSLTVTLIDNGTLTIGSGPTASTGEADFTWSSPSSQVHNITVSCTDYGNYSASSSFQVFDFRCPTTLTPQQNQTNVCSPNSTLTFYLKNAQGGSGLGNKSVNFCVNGTYLCNQTSAVLNRNYTSTTLSDGSASFTWDVPIGNGTYSISASFSGDTGHLPCQGYMSATENAIALGVLFSVNSTNILLGDTVQLNATIIDPSTNTLYATNNVNVSFTSVNSNNVSTLLGYKNTTAGIALWNTQYLGPVCAYKAEIVPTNNGTKLLQGLASSPVQLTVGNPTTLQMTVTRPDDLSFKHVISGSLLKSNGAPATNKIVTVDITSWISNQMFSETTDSNGKFSFACNLTNYVLWGPPPPGTYNYYSGEYTLEANFTGDTASNAVACSSLLGGASCTSCTTVQYGTGQSGCEPSSGSNILNVSKSVTTGAGVMQTPAEMQKDAEANGLKLWGPDSFCLWPPFFKLHAKVTLNSSGAGVQAWAGLFMCGLDSYDGLTAPLQKGLSGMNTTELAVSTGIMTSIASFVLDLYMLSFLAAAVSQLSLGVTLGVLLPAYSAAVFLSILGARAIPDSATSRAALYGIGFALLILIVGGLVSWPFAVSLPAILKQQLTGTDPVTFAARSVATAFCCTGLTAGYVLAANFLFADPLMWIFATVTFTLAVLAIYWGSVR